MPATPSEVDAGLASDAGVKVVLRPSTDPDQQRAIARVEKLVGASAAAQRRLRAVRRQCGRELGGACPKANEVEVIVERQSGTTWLDELRFFVPRSGDELFVDAGFGLYASPEPPRLSYEDWRRMDRRRRAGLEMLVALPEIDAFRRWLEREGTAAEPLSMSLWTETYPDSKCENDDPTCSFHYYVGERHPTHSVRWRGFYVQPDLFAVRVIEVARELSYDAWKGSDPLAAYQAPETDRLKAPWPAEGGGDSLGYGPPDGTVTAMQPFRHPAKTALARSGLSLVRVELYLGKTYPAFFVQRRRRAATLLARALQSPWLARQVAHRVLVANSGFPYEIVDQTDGKLDRYRFRGAARSFERKTDRGWQPL